jgi:hypothetical protein
MLIRVLGPSHDAAQKGLGQAVRFVSSGPFGPLVNWVIQEGKSKALKVERLLLAVVGLCYLVSPDCG